MTDAPTHAPGAAPSGPPGGQRVAGFQSPRNLGIAILWVALANLVLGIASLAFSIYFIYFGDGANLVGLGLGLGAIGSLSSLLGLAEIIVGIFWVHRVSANVDVFGVTRKWSTGWALWCWFIPVANLFIPFMVMAEIYRASHGGQFWQNTPLPAWFIAWWVFWVIPALTAAFGLAVNVITFFVGGNLVRLNLGSQIAGQVSTAIALVLFWKLVTTLTSAQESWHPDKP